ncbi:MAG: glycine zipper 2TM domain-containing protein [Pseudomonadota bacterium]
MSFPVSIRRAPRLALAGAIGAMGLTTAGCATSYGANDVSPSAVRTVSTIRPGVVTSVRQVQIRGEDNGVGTAGGAIIGGLAGSEIGGGQKANAAGGIAGAIIGGLIGNQIGRAANSGTGYAYVIRFEDGDMREIIQGTDILIQPGTPVHVAFRADGATVTPAPGAVQLQ